MTSFVNVAIEGCCHGELDKIYQAIAENERRTHTKVDLLLVCGDFECVRDILDLECLAVPTKYRKLNSFHQYVTGEKVAPVTTIFVGGNHEASNVLQSLYYGGWVAPKIYFMGFAGVVNFRGLRIGGLSGIFYQKHYRMGHFETPPYTEDTLRSVYHMRELEVFRMAHMIQSDRPVDILLSHDWPAGIWDYGNRDRLLRTKPYFRDDMQSGKLGNPPLMHLLMTIKPRFWFSAHLHVKFGATVQHAPYPVQAATYAIDSAVEEDAGLAESAERNEAEDAGAEVSASEDPDELDISDLQDLINSSKQRISAQATTQAQAPTSPRSTDNNTSLSELGKRSASARSPQHASQTAAVPTVAQAPVAGNTKAGAGTGVDLHYGIATHFLALDKVLPGREFLQIMQIPVPAPASPAERSQELEFDVEWLAVLRRTHDLLQTHRGVVQLPQQVDKVTPQEIAQTHSMVTNHFLSLQIPAIGPCTPTVIAGQCTPLPQSVPSRSASSGSGYDTSGSTEYVSTSAASTDQGYTAYATTEHSSSYGSGDYGSSSEQSDSKSSHSQLQYTQESYAQHQQQMQQQQVHQQHHYGGGGHGRGRGRGRNQGQQGNNNFNSSIYGPGGGGGRRDASNHSSGSGGKGGHGMLFNPTSRVTPLGNAQTDELLQALGLLHIWTRPCEYVEATASAALIGTAKAGTGTGTADSCASSVEGTTSPLTRADVTLTADAFGAPLPGSMAAPRYTMVGAHSTLPGVLPQRGRGVRPPLPPGPPPVQRQSAGNTGTVSQDIGSLNLLPGVLDVVPSAAAGKYDKYGLHAYYGSQAAYVMQADDSPTVTGSSTAEDPSELNIEEAGSVGECKEPVINVDKSSVDPNMIDLDF